MKRRRGKTVRRSEPVERRVEVAETVHHATIASGYRFGAGRCERIEVDLVNPSDARVGGGFVWIDVRGTANNGFLAALGRIYGLHPLAIEDAVHVHQRAKVEVYPGHSFFIARMARYQGCVELEQLALFLGQDFVISVQEGVDDGDPFGRLRKQLGESSPLLGTTDALAHALIDAVVDEYFPVLDAFGESLDALEDEIITGSREVLPRIQHARRDVVTLRKALWPLRDALFSLGREGVQMGPETRLYLRDTTDHVLRVLEIAEGYRELVSSLMELHLSTLSQKMNETMRFLAVISTIFIPLTFIAGVYGMNFDPEVSPLNMPELKWAWGYPVVMFGMLVIGVSLLWYFKRRGWFGGSR
jgi:magnesium transporter